VIFTLRKYRIVFSELGEIVYTQSFSFSWIWEVPFAAAQAASKESANFSLGKRAKQK
jgi:hypothetical protein